MKKSTQIMECLWAHRLLYTYWYTFRSRVHYSEIEIMYFECSYGCNIYCYKINKNECRHFAFILQESLFTAEIHLKMYAHSSNSTLYVYSYVQDKSIHNLCITILQHIIYEIGATSWMDIKFFVPKLFVVFIVNWCDLGRRVWAQHRKYVILCRLEWHAGYHRFISLFVPLRQLEYRKVDCVKNTGTLYSLVSQ